jgi:hypothetical protein
VFERLATEDRDLPAAIGDQPGALERAGGDGHGGAGRAEHHRQKLLRQRELILPDAIARGQQPPRQPLLDAMRRVARGRLHDDAGQSLGESRHHVVQRAVPLDFAAEHRRRDPVARLARHLHHRQRRLAVAGDDRRATNHPFVADGGNLHHVTVGEHRHHRHESPSREVHEVGHLARLIEHPLENQRIRLEMGHETAVFVRRQQRQQAVWNCRLRG